MGTPTELSIPYTCEKEMLSCRTELSKIRPKEREINPRAFCVVSWIPRLISSVSWKINHGSHGKARKNQIWKYRTFLVIYLWRIFGNLFNPLNHPKISFRHADKLVRYDESVWGHLPRLENPPFSRVFIAWSFQEYDRSERCAVPRGRPIISAIRSR